MRQADINKLIGLTVNSLELSSNKYDLTLKTDKGDVVLFCYADCCSDTWIEHLETPKLPATILSVDEKDLSECTPDGTRQEFDQKYSTILKTSQGDFEIEFRNSSNGYYGGSLEVRWPKDESGFGLVETLVALTIMSIVLVGTMSLIRFTLLASATGDAKNSVAALVGSLTGIALNPVSCTLAVTKSPQSYNPNLIRFDLPDGNVIAPLADLPNYGVYIDQFQFIGAKLVTTNPDGSKVYYGNLAVTIGTNREVLGPSKFAPRIVGAVYLSVSSSNVITQCGASMPSTVTQTPQSLPNAPVEPKPSDEVTKTCSQMGGKMNGMTCDLHECGRD